MCDESWRLWISQVSQRLLKWRVLPGGAWWELEPTVLRIRRLFCTCLLLGLPAFVGALDALPVFLTLLMFGLRFGLLPGGQHQVP